MKDGAKSVNNVISKDGLADGSMCHHTHTQIFYINDLGMTPLEIRCLQFYLRNVESLVEHCFKYNI